MQEPPCRAPSADLPPAHHAAVLASPVRRRASGHARPSSIGRSAGRRVGSKGGWPVRWAGSPEASKPAALVLGPRVRDRSTGMSDGPFLPFLPFLLLLRRHQQASASAMAMSLSEGKVHTSMQQGGVHMRCVPPYRTPCQPNLGCSDVGSGWAPPAPARRLDRLPGR
jgi:hypothetical protein